MIRAAVLAIGLMAPAARADPVVIPFEDAYPPFSAAAEDGTPDGFNIAVAREIAERMGVVPEFVAADFDTIQFGDWPEDWAFSVASMSLSSDREAKFAFVGPYYFDQVVIVTRTASGLGFDRARLPGHSFGVCQGCIYGPYLTGENGLTIDGRPASQPLGAVEVRSYASDFDVLRALGEADPPEIDYGLTSVFHVRFYESLGFPVRHDSRPVLVTPLWVVVPLGRTEALAAVERAFASLRDSGRLAELSLRYLGEDFTGLAPGQ